MELPGISPAAFYLRNRRHILVLAPPLAVLCAFKTLTGMNSGETYLNWLAGLVLWLFLLIVALRRRLVLTQQGIEYTDTFSTVHIPWAQVTRLVSRKTLGIFPVDGLEAWTQSPRLADRFIDLSQFSRAWRLEQLGAILHERVPHLFQQGA
jgi:hypothetical protein